MALREVVDADGNRWRVWEVVPVHALGRVIERRDVATPRGRQSWLVCVCESLRERRRSYDYPADWTELPDAELIALCMKGNASVAPRRLID